MKPAEDDGNCLPSHHDDTRGGFQPIESYDACEEEEEGDGGGARDGASAASEDDEDVALSLNELMYSAHSFHVISLPGE